MCISSSRNVAVGDTLILEKVIMEIIVNQKNVLGRCIRRDVQCLRVKGRNGVEYVPVEDATCVNVEAFSCFSDGTTRRWSTAGIHYSQYLPTDEEWRTVPEGGARVEVGEGAGPSSYKTWPAGTRYKLRVGGNAYCAATVCVIYPDRAYGPDARRA